MNMLVSTNHGGSPTESRACRACQPRARGKKWPLFIVGLLMLNVTVVALTVALATGDRSFGVEPDYYQKAVNWDRAAARAAHAHDLGWTATTTINEPRNGESKPRLTVRLHAAADRSDAKVIDGASVTFESFAHARSSRRLTGTLTERSPGTYEAEVEIDRPGLWEVRLNVRRGGEIIDFKSTLMVSAAEVMRR